MTRIINPPTQGYQFIDVPVGNALKSFELSPGLLDNGEDRTSFEWKQYLEATRSPYRLFSGERFLAMAKRMYDERNGDDKHYIKALQKELRANDFKKGLVLATIDIYRPIPQRDAVIDDIMAENPRPHNAELAGPNGLLNESFKGFTHANFKTNNVDEVKEVLTWIMGAAPFVFRQEKPLRKIGSRHEQSALKLSHYFNTSPYIEAWSDGVARAWKPINIPRNEGH